MARRFAFVSAVLLLAACADTGAGDAGAGGGLVWSGAGAGGADAMGSGASGGNGGSGTAGNGIGADDTVCPVRFSMAEQVEAPRVAGEWQGYELATATALAPDGSGFAATVPLKPGLHAYKMIYGPAGQETWALDAGATRRKYVDGVENSGVKVPDCGLPSLTVVESDNGAGSYHAVLSYVDAIDESGPAPEAFVAELVHDDETRALEPEELSVAADGTVTIDLAGLADGKHRVVVRAATKSERLSEPLRLVVWIEDEPFDWRDALVYMVVTDRFQNGTTANDAAPTNGADPRGDWQGGDLEGVRQAIADGTLDELGVRAIWLTPFNTNPDGGELASDDQHVVTGYHGYWPVKAREVDPRIGGEDALRALVREAHAHGIRVLQDYVINHVHEDHEYVAAHPDWFRTGCVCGTAGCDWTEHALDCMFRQYMPDIDHTVPEANAAFTSDAIWWLDELDLDGLRVDAVKHVEEIATRNLAAEVRETFEAAGTRYFLMGETAMGWNDCGDPCNDENYGTIAKYVGPHGLDGQFDFVLYHGVSYRTFAYGDEGLAHADYWLKHGLEKWPAGAVMTPYIGSHDTARFASLADYRGQDGQHDRGIPGNQWSNIAVAPSDGEPYRRTRIAMSWLLMLPGAPLLYYGDEYGQWGGADPNNRLFWRGNAALSGDEVATLTHVQKLGQARQQIEALRRGDYQTLFVNDDTLAFARTIAGGDGAIVALTRKGTSDGVVVDASSVGFASGTVLQDALGGPNVTVGGDGMATLSVPASGAVVLAP